MAEDHSMLGSKSDPSLSVGTSTRASSLLVFFVATYALAWIFFVSLAAAVSISTLLGRVLALAGAFAPSLVALTLTARDGGRAAVRALLRRILQWQVPERWYVFAVGYMVAIKLTVALVHWVATGAWPRFGSFPWYLIPFAILTSTPFQAGEEIGWRGYALARLATRFGLARASVLLGVIWACWHLPLFFVRGTDTYGQSFFVYLLQVTALSVAIAWLYERTGGSLLLPMLMHAAVNNTKDIVPSPLPGAMNTFGFNASLVAWLTVAALWICAAYFLASMARREPRFR